MLVEEEVAGSLLVETGCYMRNLGLVVIDAGVPKNEGIAYGDYDGKDKATQAIIDDVQEQVEKELGVVLASTPFPLINDKAEYVNEEVNLGDLVALIPDPERLSARCRNTTHQRHGNNKSSYRLNQKATPLFFRLRG